jgi:poly(3-hydroxybutyrate) depolymerase
MEGAYFMTRRFCKLFQMLLAVGFVMLAAVPGRAEVLDKTKTIAGTEIHYKVVLPNGYDPAKAYPAVLAFPGGPQTMEMVEGTLERNWHQQAEKLGYIVIIPAAPNGQLFFEGGAKFFPEFIVKLLADYKVQDNKFFMAGVSNGGLSAFHIAALYPQYFWSVTGLPGFLLDPTPARVHALSKLCIYMYAGQLDTDWSDSEREQSAKLRAQGFTVEFNEEKGEGHVMRTLDGDGAMRLFKQFEQARHGCGK